MIKIKKCLFTCLLGVFTFFVVFTVYANTKVIYWGVYYPNPGYIPIGNVTYDYLSEYDAFYHGFANGEKVLYLTFDAGYEDGNTEKILDSLKERNVPATFFLTGNYIKTNPEITKRMVNEGHIVGNHTMTHPDMYKLKSLDFASELEKVEEIYKDVIGFEMPKYYRPPACAFNEQNLIDAKALKVLMICKD
ncbi:MAG: polysaccharide deacetylase family protein [Clostridiales bacterium]|nr:polysaccharide deacetylase family protein [Clostridiales bacterium]